MSRESDRAERGTSWRDDRVWQAGFLIGSALGAAVTVAGRRAEKEARRGLVDWPSVERIAIERLRSAPGSLSPAELRAAEPEYAEAMARIVPALSSALGSPLPGVVESAVIGAPHPDLGEAVVAVMMVAPTAHPPIQTSASRPRPRIGTATM